MQYVFWGRNKCKNDDHLFSTGVLSVSTHDKHFGNDSPLSFPCHISLPSVSAKMKSHEEGRVSHSESEHAERAFPFTLCTQNKLDRFD